jgi:hypothetical protein
MSPTISITITLPEGASVDIAEAPASAEPSLAARVESYWNQLSDNGKRVFAAAARIEDFTGPGFTFDDIAEKLSIPYESAKSMHRTSGRTARKWREDTATEPPIDLVDMGEYGWKQERGGQRTVYRLPKGVAELLLDLATV